VLVYRIRKIAVSGGRAEGQYITVGWRFHSTIPPVYHIGLFINQTNIHIKIKENM